MSDEPIYTGVGLVHAADSADSHYVDIDTMGAAVDLAGPTRLIPASAPIITGGAVDHVRDALVPGKDGVGKAYQMSYPQQGTGQGAGFRFYQPPVLDAKKTHVIQYLFKMGGSVNGPFAIKWFLFPLNHAWIGQGGGEPQWSTHNFQPFVGSTSGKDTVWQIYHTITDNMNPYPDGCDQGTQPFGPYLQDLFDGQWHRATHAYKCHTVELTKVTVAANGSKVAPASFEVSMAGKFVNGDIIGLQGIGGCIVSAFDGDRSCTLTSINRVFAKVVTNPAVTTNGAGGSIPAATKYYYRVGAIYGPNAADIALPSAEVSVTTGAGSANSNTVTWDAMPNATGYYVYRGTSAGAGSTVRFAVGNVTSFTDTGAGGSAGQSVQIQAMDPAQPFAFTTVFDGFMKMWVDGVKILDGSKDGLNYKPPGGEKQYIGRDDFYNQIVGLANAPTYGPRWGGWESQGYSTASTSVAVNLGNGDPYNPDGLKWWAVDSVVTAESAADHLALTQQPSASTQSGQPHAQQPAGVIRDSANATVTGDTSTVTATLVLESGTGTPRGTLSVTCVAGAFGFTNLGVDSAGGCTAHWQLSRPGLPPISTASFTITPPPVASIPFRSHRAAIL